MNIINKPKNLQNIFNLYLSKILRNKNVLILKILEQRAKAATIIQKFYRRYSIQLDIIAYRERGKNYYQIPYSIKWEDPGSESDSSQERTHRKRKNSINSNKEEIYLEILFPKSEKNKYNLQLCKYRNINVAYIPKEKFMFNKGNGKTIYFKFKEGEKDCIDPNYEIALLNSKEKKFCNVIDLNTIDNFQKVTQSILHRRKTLYDSSYWQQDKNKYTENKNYSRQAREENLFTKKRKGHGNNYNYNNRLDKSVNYLSYENFNDESIKRKIDKFYRIRKHLKKFICYNENNFCKIFNLNLGPKISMKYYKSEEKISNVSRTLSILLDNKNTVNTDNYEFDSLTNPKSKNPFFRKIYSKSE